MAMKIAILGAESTGKTSLSLALEAHGRAKGFTVQRVPELLRPWCEAKGRPPRQDEQRARARAQAQAVIDAARTNPSPDWLLADTTALQIAVYSDFYFQDTRLYPLAEQDLRRFDHTLLMAVDLPWVADGLQRDGPQVQAPVDALLRQALVRTGVRFSVVAGQGPTRLAQALAALPLANGA
jgi:nicotinamide riboside kinase